MNKNQEIEILYKNIISPIEIYLKPKMTVQEEFLAKNEVFPEIKQLIKEFCIQNSISEEKIIGELKQIIEGRKKLHNCDKQYELVSQILDGIISREDKEL